MKKKRKTIYPSIRDKRQRKLKETQSIKQSIILFLTNKVTLSITTGLLVGSVFGLISLNILKDEQGDISFSDEEAVNTQLTAKATADDKQTLSFEDPSFYVIQNGLFHERENAENTQIQLQGKNIPSFIWEREGQFYVLHSIYKTRTLAEQGKGNLESTDVDAYVKEWDMLVTDKNVSKEEQEWLEQFLTIWSETVGQVNDKKEIEVKQWQPLLQTDYQSDLITSVQNEILEMQGNLERKEQTYVSLLAILYHVEQALGE